MGVVAHKIISGESVIREWECGTFDLMLENGGFGWTEISRDCDRSPRRRREWPFASRAEGGSSSSVQLLPDRIRMRKYFAAADDSFVSTLDISDLNGGVMPSQPCLWVEVWQSGKRIPCEGYELNQTTGIITINSAWRTPGAGYEVFIWVSPQI